MPAPDVTHYIGDELTLFEKATNWKSYYGNKLKPHLKGRVLEVGAGIGGTTLSLCDGTQADWLCVEPDADLAANIQDLLNSGQLPACCRLHTGLLADLPATDLYNAILYIDVIEHIEHDAAELARAYEHLAPGGVLLIIVPAHQWLFSPFDKAIGHFRRYSRTSLLRVMPPQSKILQASYLDSVGMLASTANKLLLKQSNPTLKQIKFWDTMMVPISRFTDKLLLHNFGKSVLVIAQKS
ncbi:methyltransferase domain-containing protein [Hymenobacter taeanensis]|uniref:Methyltransferase domain-containing protein n=1 Tax=Hymenobacter taeanensis TaxID=2735321 RepID=A0A6M6BBE4_9BACT|nr:MULTISPECIES: methyltransferase domain-containing protein [Hymenobacter]QJX45681.1 methyltransferase domain-containing protein [Hymenobacter taeanensis]UOQ79518.1 class I SAM-dependent methyltransferase [Hymenobacter sp. 5414T-23]